MSPEAAAHAAPFIWWAIFTVSVVVAILGAAWGGFVWLRARIKEEFQGLTASDEFKKLVRSVVSEAASGWLDIDNRQHEEHRAAVKDLRERDKERAEAVKRLHVRVDRIWERFGQSPPEVE